MIDVISVCEIYQMHQCRAVKIEKEELVFLLSTWIIQTIMKKIRPLTFIDQEPDIQTPQKSGSIKYLEIP